MSKPYFTLAFSNES